MTLAIAHSQLSEDKKRSIAVLDAVREIRAPFISGGCGRRVRDAAEDLWRPKRPRRSICC